MAQPRTAAPSLGDAAALTVYAETVARSYGSYLWMQHAYYQAEVRWQEALSGDGDASGGLPKSSIQPQQRSAKPRLLPWYAAPLARYSVPSPSVRPVLCGAQQERATIFSWKLPHDDLRRWRRLSG